MKTLLFLLFCLLSVSVVTNAQTKDEMKKGRQKKASNIDSTREQELLDKGVNKENLKELDLTKEQQLQIDELYKNVKGEKEKIKNDTSLSDAQKQEKMGEVNKQAKNKLSKILTKEQQEKIKKQQKSKAEKAGDSQ